MKRIIPLLLSILVCFNGHSQVDTSNISKKPATDYSSLIKKSKNQKKAAWILLGGGTALIITGIITLRITEGGIPGFVYDDEVSGPGTVIFLAGSVSVLGSIPLFIAAGKNKRKAAAISASLKINNAKLIQGCSLTRINYPALSVKISLLKQKKYS